MIELSYRLDLSDSEIEEIIEKYYSEKSEQTKTFIRRAIKKYGDVYVYSETEFISWRDELKIYCPKCDLAFSTAPGRVLHKKSGPACPKCSRIEMGKGFREKARKTFEERLEKYQPDYELVSEYISKDKKVLVRNRLTGEEIWVLPSKLRDRHTVEKICSVGEALVEECLSELKLDYQKQKLFTVDEVPDLYKVRTTGLKVDFYLEHSGLKYVIEYNGEQHYKESSKFTSHGEGSAEVYIKQVKRDQILNTFCGYKGYILIVIPYTVTKKSVMLEGLKDIIINGNLQNTQKYFPDREPNPVATEDNRWEEIITWEESENE